MKNLQLSPIKKLDYVFLYELLEKRNPIENISHKNLPTFEKHVEFIKSKPYSKWYVITKNDKKIGSAYITKLGELAIHLLSSHENDRIRKQILKLLITKNPRKRYLYNVSNNNQNLIKFLQKNNFKLIQFTYEIMNFNLEN